MKTQALHPRELTFASGKYALFRIAAIAALSFFLPAYLSYSCTNIHLIQVLTPHLQEIPVFHCPSFPYAYARWHKMYALVH